MREGSGGPEARMRPNEKARRREGGSKALLGRGVFLHLPKVVYGHAHSCNVRTVKQRYCARLD